VGLASIKLPTIIEGGTFMFNNDLNQFIDTALLEERSIKTKRSYLGASRLGAECSRALQYEFMGRDPAHSARTLRVFEAGHLFEELIIQWLRLTGLEILTKDSNGNQFAFSAANGRIAGHIDGVVIAAPSALNLACPALFEAKSMNNKSWQETAKRGLVLSKPLYAAQIALYQAYMEENFPGISQNPCLFIAINKDTSELYHELLPFDGELAQRMSDKAVNIIRATEVGELLPRGFSSSDTYQCKICPYKEECWSEK
jgi:hypothetical protein